MQSIAAIGMVILSLDTKMSIHSFEHSMNIAQHKRYYKYTDIEELF